MEIKAKITKKFTFKLSEEDISSVIRIFSLIEKIEEIVFNYDIDTTRLVLDNANAEDWISYDDLVAMKKKLEFLEYCETINIEEDIEEL